MSDHDLRCRGKDHEVGLGCCDCAFIDLIRFEQNERIAQAIEGRAEAFITGSHDWFALQRAARIARNGGNNDPSN